MAKTKKGGKVGGSKSSTNKAPKDFERKKKKVGKVTTRANQPKVDLRSNKSTFENNLKPKHKKSPPTVSRMNVVSVYKSYWFELHITMLISEKMQC